MENNYEYVQEVKAKKGSVVRGLIGALLGALIGAVIWCLVSVGTEHIYSMIGFVVGLLVGFGYDLLKGRKGTIRMVIVFLCVILSVTVGTIGAYGWWIHDWYNEECDFITTASKEELAEAFLTAEELEALNSYPAPLKQRVLDALEIPLPTEQEYFQWYLEDPEFISDVGGECVSSILFALLGSFALILNNGKKEKAAAQTANVEFNEAAMEVDSASSETDANADQEQA